MKEKKFPLSEHVSKSGPWAVFKTAASTQSVTLWREIMFLFRFSVSVAKLIQFNVCDVKEQ